MRTTKLRKEGDFSRERTKKQELNSQKSQGKNKKTGLNSQKAQGKNKKQGSTLKKSQGKEKCSFVRTLGFCGKHHRPAHFLEEKNLNLTPAFSFPKKKNFENEKS